MAHRATASFGTKETETGAFASLTAADVIRAPSVERRIPVDFRALLKPHKKAGRLRLRIERLPQGTKLSAGRRSEDNSWSLASDELEDLHFLAFSNVARDYELTVRVMAFEDDEISTLSVVPFVILASDDTVSVQAGRDPPRQDPVIRSQLSEMNSLFAVREVELLELRAALQHAIGERDAELAKARRDWELEVDRRVAEAVEQSRVHDRQEYEAKEEAGRKSRAAQEELTVEKAAAERRQAKAESERRSQAERQLWESESAARLEGARREWEVEAGRGLKAARQAWQVASEKRIEEERQKWQAQAEGDTAKERDRWKSDAAQQLDVARQAWQAEADEHRKVDLESWNADADRRIEAEREMWLAQAGEQTRAEFERSKAEIEARCDAERRAWKMQWDAQARRERDRWEADAEALLAAERKRLAAEAEQWIAAERQRLLSENANAAKTQSVREGANHPAAATSQVDHETVEKLAEERDKNRQLNKGLQAAADKNRELAAALAAMTLRCENAERAPAAAKSPPPVPDMEDGYIKSLRSEIATLHKSLANEAAELGRARAELEQARPLHIQRAPENRRIGALRDFQNEEEQTPGREKSKGLIRDCILIVAIVIPLVLFYPWIAVYLPQGVRDGIATATGGLMSVEIVQPAVSKKPLPPPRPVRPTAIASRVLNVHASPALKGAVILSVRKNTSVVVLEKQGNWSKIEMPAEGAGKPQQGWVWGAYLQSKDR